MINCSALIDSILSNQRRTTRITSSFNWQQREEWRGCATYWAIELLALCLKNIRKYLAIKRGVKGFGRITAGRGLSVHKSVLWEAEVSKSTAKPDWLFVITLQSLDTLVSTVVFNFVWLEWVVCKLSVIMRNKLTNELDTNWPRWFEYTFATLFSIWQSSDWYSGMPQLNLWRFIPCILLLTRSNCKSRTRTAATSSTGVAAVVIVIALHHTLRFIEQSILTGREVFAKHLPRI